MLINLTILYLTHEIITGIQVIRREHTYKKSAYIPPSLFFHRERTRYLEWREQQ